MIAQPPRLSILCADDDPDDQVLTRDAILESGIPADVRFVSDGEELLDALRGCDPPGADSDTGRPNLILLDLNMPKMGGAEALRLLKTDPDLRRIPIVVLTTSRAASDIDRSYDDGANAYVVKPLTFEEFRSTVRDLAHHWLDLAEHPR